jgi:DNA replication protein DnaC
MAAIQEILAKMPKQTAGVDPIRPRKPKSDCIPDCAICSGVGVIRYNVPIDNNLFGVIDPCPNQPRRNSLTHSGLYLSDLDSTTWETIEATPVKLIYEGKEYKTDARRVAERVRVYVERGYGLVYLYAGYGQAKTLILKAATAAAVKTGRPAFYVQFADMLDMMRSEFKRDMLRTEGMTREVSKLVNAQFLAIDEFDKINMTDWVAQEAFRLIDKRYNQAIHCESVTMIASNKKPGEIDPAIASRIHDGRALYIQMEGKDRRPEQKW